MYSLRALLEVAILVIQQIQDIPIYCSTLKSIIMIRINFSMLALLLLLVLSACNKEESIQPDTHTELETRSVHVQTSPVLDPINGMAVIGEAQLKRQARGITAKYRTDGLIPGHTYTLWWVIWNKPENCIAYPGPCDAPDFAIADEVAVEVMYAAGRKANGKGEAVLTAHLNRDNASGTINDLFGLSSYGGLHDPYAAEVHLVLRSHGPAIPGQLDDQISSYLGGCTVFLPDFTEVPDEEGECADLHFAIFQPE